MNLVGFQWIHKMNYFCTLAHANTPRGPRLSNTKIDMV